MESEGNKEAIRRLYVDGFNAGNQTVVNEVVADDVVLHGPAYGQGARGVQAIDMIKGEIAGYHAGNNTIQITILELIAEGNRWPPTLGWI